MACLRVTLTLFFTFALTEFGDAMIFPDCNSVEIVRITESLAQDLEKTGFLRIKDPEVLKKVLSEFSTDTLNFSNGKDYFSVHVVTPKPSLNEHYTQYSQQILRIRQAMETLKVPPSLKQRIMERIHKALINSKKYWPSSDSAIVVGASLIGSALGIGFIMVMDSYYHFPPSYGGRAVIGGIAGALGFFLGKLSTPGGGFYTPEEKPVSFSKMIMALKAPVRFTLSALNEMTLSKSGGALYIILQDQKEIELFRDKILEALNAATPNGYSVIQGEVPN